MLPRRKRRRTSLVKPVGNLACPAVPRTAGRLLAGFHDRMIPLNFIKIPDY